MPHEYGYIGQSIDADLKSLTSGLQPLSSASKETFKHDAAIALAV